MNQLTFDVNQSLAGLAQFDRAAANSAQHFNAQFTTQLDALSTTFQETAEYVASTFELKFAETFTEINAMFSDSALQLSEAFGTANEEIIENLLEMQLYGEESFLALQEASALFAEEFIAELQEVQIIGEEAYLALKEKSAIFTEESIAGLQEIQAIGEEAYLALQEAAALSAEMSTIAYEMATDMIAELFDTTTQGVKTNLLNVVNVADEAAASMAEIYSISAQEIEATWAVLEVNGSAIFALLSVNATNSFFEARDNIFAGTNALRLDFAATGASMEASMRTAFGNIVAAFSSSLATMRTESSTQFGNIAANGQTAATDISRSFSAAFTTILKNLIKLGANMNPVLSGIHNAFSTTAQNAERDFTSSMTNIGTQVVVFGDVTVQACNSSRDAFDWLTQGVDLIANGLTILLAIIGAVAAAKVAKAASAFVAAGGMAALAITTTAAKTALTMGVAGAIIAASTIAATATMRGAMGTFAQGGFPTQGQMFIAREAGPELVGSIGGRTAVANNDQIVESVSRGVFDAVRAAMGNKDNGNGKPLSVNLYLDGREITTAVERVQRERGLPLIVGAYA